VKVVLRFTLYVEVAKMLGERIYNRDGSREIDKTIAKRLWLFQVETVHLISIRHFIRH
jgi:hypothetical protein